MKRIFVSVCVLATVVLVGCKGQSEQEKAQLEITKAVNSAKEAADAANAQTQKALEQANVVMDDAFKNANKQLEEAKKAIPTPANH